MNQNSNHKFSDGERNLFKSFADHIQANPNDYKEAGEWLDEYCSESTYWLRQDNKLEELKKKNTQFPVLAHQITIKNLENQTKEKRTPALIIRFQEAQDYLLNKYGDEEFVSKEIAAKVIVITWLLTDPDADKKKLGITKLEKWPWEPIDDVSKMTRSYKGFLFAQNKDAWMRLVCIGWDGITTRGTKAAPKHKRESAETRTDKFIKKIKDHPVISVIIVLAIIIIAFGSLAGGIDNILSLWNEIANSSNKSADIFAEVSKEGEVLRSNNFPWEIRKSSDEKGNVRYTIVDRRGDATAISVVPDNPKYTVHQSYDGMVIQFTCAEEEISNFKIEFKY